MSSKSDRERLSSVFESLNKQGIISIQDAGETRSDGLDDVYSQYQRKSGKKSRGYCFYHRQDLERACKGGGLMLAFGAFDSSGITAENVAISIVNTLNLFKFQNEWSGSIKERIYIPNINM